MTDDVVLRKSEYLENWYVLERAEHDGRKWLERIEQGVLALRCSSRLSDADVEGTAAEWLAIGKAIETGQDVDFNRCAVRHVAGEGVSIEHLQNKVGEILGYSAPESRRARFMELVESAFHAGKDARPPQVQLWSPRNSLEPGIVSPEAAKKLAKQIRELLA